MSSSPEEIARRKDVMAAARHRVDRDINEVNVERQAKVAAAIHQSIAEAPPSVPIEEAIEMLKRYGEDER
jgi:hypothetical protein